VGGYLSAATTPDDRASVRSLGVIGWRFALEALRQEQDAVFEVIYE
jgi:hypothetical protein